mmetsp:Transcript_25926/g.59690  ORF Transcript_25926/g.59690 Transcript_25926/m.59690 type:complete len:92 (-) Transcript_25926:46-321(-)
MMTIGRKVTDLLQKSPKKMVGQQSSRPHLHQLATTMTPKRMSQSTTGMRKTIRTMKRATIIGHGLLNELFTWSAHEIVLLIERDSNVLSYS